MKRQYGISRHGSPRCCTTSTSTGSARPTGRSARRPRRVWTGSGARPGGRFVGFGPAHLLTTGALVELAGELERVSVHDSRFRPNVILESSGDPVPRQELRIGDVVLRVLHSALRHARPDRRRGSVGGPAAAQRLGPGTTAPGWATWAGRRASAPVGDPPDTRAGRLKPESSDSGDGNDPGQSGAPTQRVSRPQRVGARAGSPSRRGGHRGGWTQAAVREHDHRFVAVRGEHDLDGRTAGRQRVAAGESGFGQLAGIAVGAEILGCSGRPGVGRGSR